MACAPPFSTDNFFEQLEKDKRAQCFPADETYSTGVAICPYCGYRHDPAESDGVLYDEMTCEYECVICDKTFQVRVYKSFSWTCKPISPTVESKENNEKHQ